MGIKLHRSRVYIDDKVAKQAIHVLGIIARAGGPKSIFATLTGDLYSASGHAMAVAMANSVLETNDLHKLFEDEAEDTTGAASAIPPLAAPNSNEF